jgi:hypothetical protein
MEPEPGMKKTRANLSGQEYRDMLQMLKELTPAERASLKDPDFITEDEADLIVCDRRSNEGTVPAENVLAELGYSLHR